MTYKNLSEKEYLITNGIGGFCSSSITGANTRKYHALLNASLNPPVNRHVLLSKLESIISVGEDEFTLESTEYLNRISDHSKLLEGYSYLPIPTFKYNCNGIKIVKQIAMKYLENTSCVNYTITTKEKEISFKAILHVNSRNHHDLSSTNDFSYEVENNNTYLSFINSSTNFYINGFGEYIPTNKWAKSKFYAVEKRRGQGSIDTNYIPGYFEVTIPANTTVTFEVIASTMKNSISNGSIISDEITRRQELTSHEDDELLKALNIACDHFIVYRQSTNSKTVIAGYPWFTDWGRDTMIALPGLTLSTKRYADAKNIISTFIKYIDHGLIPNMFPDDNVTPMYNTIDGTLWMFIAVYKYFLDTNDKEFIRSIFSDLEGIINAHINGTKYGIKVDHDGLLTGGDETTQLTWMDVKIDGHVVTPRHGKAVEINALWYNALMVMKSFITEVSVDSNIDYDKYSELCKNNFKMFWNVNENCLYDLIQNGKKINKIRPNQIFAVSLPFSLLSLKKEKLVLDAVENHLLTPYGLRSLSDQDSDYIKYYGGDIYKRDYAYHQGTVWAWLMGPYLEAHFKIYNDKEYVTDKLIDLKKHLEFTGLGTISEVFSGDSPHESRGCFAQAWSVSEYLRIIKLISN